MVGGWLKSLRGEVPVIRSISAEELAAGQKGTGLLLNQDVHI